MPSIGEEDWSAILLHASIYRIVGLRKWLQFQNSIQYIQLDVAQINWLLRQGDMQRCIVLLQKHAYIRIKLYRG